MSTTSIDRVRRLGAAAVLAGTVALVPAPASAASGHHRPVCAPVAASGTGQDLGGGQTVATLTVAGTTVATSAASFSTTGLDGAVASFTGPIVLTPVLDFGTLTAAVAGTFDTSTGAFRATSTSLTGTGALHAVTGSLTFDGTEDPTTGAFTERVTGLLCTSLPG